MDSQICTTILSQQLLGVLGLSSQAPLDEERLMEPRGCQQPLCSLVKAEFLALTSMLSQLLEKQRKLICVNDRLRFWQDDRPECVSLSSKALPRPGTSVEGCQALHATVEVAGVCLKTKTQKSRQPRDFVSCMDLFSGLRSSPVLSQLHLFCSEPHLQIQRVRGGTDPACVRSPLRLEDSSVCKCFLCML